MDYQGVIKMLKANEGFRSKPYRCSAGKLTIGYGRNIQERGIDESEAASMLINDIEEVVADLHSIFQGFDDYSDSRQAALIDMRFQLGYGGFRGFKKMIAAVRAGDWKEAARQVKDSDYYRQVTGRAERVVGMMIDGQ